MKHDDLRNGPIPPEEHPMVPWPVRMGLQEMRHKREVAVLREQLARKERGQVVKRLLWYALLLWTAYATLAYFGLLDEGRDIWNGLLHYLEW